MLQKLRSPLGCLLVSALLLVGGLVLLFVLAIRRGGDPYIGEVLLADGVHRLRLYQTTDGPLKYEWKPPVMQRYLPLPGRSHIPSIDVNLDGLDRWQNEPGYSFLFRAVDAQGRYANPPGRVLEFEFVESTGFVFKQPIGTADFPHWGTHALTRCALPRRDKDLLIRIRNRVKPKSKPVDMTVPNPCYRTDFPVWEAETLPIEKTKGPLTVRLAAFVYQYSRIYPEFSAISSDPSWASPNFQYSLEDATGNRGEILSPFEPVWKLKTKVYRYADAEFPVFDRSVLENLKILVAGTVKPINQKLQIGGFECRVLCIAGAGIVHESKGQFTAKPLGYPDTAQMFSGGYANGQSYMEVSRPNPFVWIEMLAKLPHGQRIEVQYFLDGQRTACPLGHIGSNDRTFIVAELPVIPSTAEVDLTIALSRPEEFEFLVAPPANARVELTKPESEN